MPSGWGVSRQAVSQWETEPEIGKLRTLAAVFSVSTDWFLSEEEPPAPTSEPAPATDWVDALPGTLRKLFRRYGWLGGVYLMLAGGIFAFDFFRGFAITICSVTLAARRGSFSAAPELYSLCSRSSGR